MQERIDPINALATLASVGAMIAMGFVVHALMWRSIPPSGPESIDPGPPLLERRPESPRATPERPRATPLGRTLLAKI